MRKIHNSKSITLLASTVLILTVFSCENVGAYEVELIWENAYGGIQDDFAEDILLTADGNVVMVGSTFSFGAGKSDIYLLKTDINGLKLWDKTYGTSEYEYGNAFRLTSDNGLIIAGWKSHEPWINYAKLLLVKADSDGNEVWTENYPYNDGGAYAYSVTEAFNGEYVATGGFHFGNYSVVGLVRTDLSGNQIWQKAYDSPLSYAEAARHIERTVDGGFILCGYESDNTPRGFLLKTNQNNDLQWRDIYFNDSHCLVFTCVRLTTDGNYIVSGYTHWNYHYDGYIAKIDQEGNMLWSREYDWESKDELFTSIIETGTDEYVICGYTKNPYKAICLKVNSYGNVLWKKVLGNANNAMAVIKTDNRTLYVTGKTSRFGAGSDDVYLAKIQEPVISTPLLYAEPNELLFVSSFDYNQPIIQTAEIYNQGIGVLNWNIQEDCNWLDVTPTSGSSIGDINEIEISVNKTGLDVGTYTYGVQVIDSNAVNSPYIIKVKLIIHGYTVNVPDEFDTIQQAIDAVSDGNTIIVGPGIHEGEGNYDIDFKGKAITVRGANPNDPNVVALTIIDGSSIDDGQYHNGFYFHSNEDSNSMLLGLSIKGFMGDGIAISNARPVIRKCRIYGNENGISANYTSSENVETLIEDCTISHNAGPGISFDRMNVKVDNCIIENNEGSGISTGGRATGDLLLEKCQISRNKYIGLDLRSSYDSVFLNNCSIIANKGDNGGGICSSCNLTVENSIIAGNYSSYNGGAIVFYDPLTLKNCTIIGNCTERDYVISCNSYVGADIKNCVIWDNYPDSKIGFRGNHNNFISYCSIKGGVNSIQLDSGAILNWGPGNIDVDPCFVAPGYWDANGTPEDSNDDFWVDGDYHLKSEGWRPDVQRKVWTWDDVTSRCIDAGNPGSPLGDELLSVPDDPNNIWGENLRINMGAYGGTAEASMPPYDWAILGDLTNDGLVNLTDFAFQAADWLNSADQQPGDLNRDSLIYISDLALLVEDWLKQTTWHE